MPIKIHPLVENKKLYTLPFSHEPLAMDKTCRIVTISLP